VKKKNSLVGQTPNIILNPKLSSYFKCSYQSEKILILLHWHK
jgi:hypothetical protein